MCGSELMVPAPRGHCRLDGRAGVVRVSGIPFVSSLHTLAAAPISDRPFPEWFPVSMLPLFSCIVFASADMSRDRHGSFKRQSPACRKPGFVDSIHAVDNRFTSLRRVRLCLSFAFQRLHPSVLEAASSTVRIPS